MTDRSAPPAVILLDFSPWEVSAAHEALGRAGATSLAARFDLATLIEAPEAVVGNCVGGLILTTVQVTEAERLQTVAALRSLLLYWADERSEGEVAQLASLISLMEGLA